MVLASKRLQGLARRLHRWLHAGCSRRPSCLQCLQHFSADAKPLDVAAVTSAGNAAASGAQIALLSQKARDDVEHVAH